MTDKEIIIDGVNVVGCEYYQIEANELYPKAQYCGSMRNTFCENEPNCYYKRLKRLEFENKLIKADYEASEQENAELKAELQKFKDMAKKGLDEFKDVGGCWGCGLQLELNHDMEYIKQLKAENEQLKALCDTYKTCYQAKHNDIDGKLFKYRQTLQEIENVLLWIDSSNVWYNGQKAYMGDELIEFLKSRIINIINSTKAEEE